MIFTPPVFHTVEENSKWKSQDKHFPLFHQLICGPFCYYIWASHLCGCRLTNAFHLFSLQVTCHLISLYFGVGHMGQMRYWWQKATVLLSWPSPRCFTLPSKLQLGWFTWRPSTSSIGILLPVIAWLVRTYWWRLGILGCLEMCTAQTTIG